MELERKRVFLVRHAQSEANVASARLENGEVSALWPFLTVGSDAPLSDMGRQQLAAARAQLVASRFVEERGVQLVAHSPLVRAEQTARQLFGDCGPSLTPPFVELPFIYERTPSEWASITGLDARIEQLRAWLAARDESVIVLVGHGQFFKRCLHRGFVQANVSILECSFSARDGFCLQAEMHPAAEATSTTPHVTRADEAPVAASGDDSGGGGGGGAWASRAVGARSSSSDAAVAAAAAAEGDALRGVGAGGPAASTPPAADVPGSVVEAAASAAPSTAEGETGGGAAPAASAASADDAAATNGWWGAASLRALYTSAVGA